MDNLLQELKARIANRGIIVIAGCGVSASTVADGQRPLTSWSAFLLTGVERCRALDLCNGDWVTRRTADIQSGELNDMLLAAQALQQKLGSAEGGEFATWLRTTVGSLTVHDSRTIKAIQRLGASITTTNYDSLIERVTGLERATQREPGRAQRIINGDEAAVLHLHGHYLQPETVVLGVTDYFQVATDEKTQTLQRTMATAKSLLFIGCGGTLEDPNLGALLNWLKSFRESQNRHYLLVRNSERSAYRNSYPLTETRIAVIGYGDDYTKLPAFLESLAPPVHPPVTLTAPSTPSPIGLPGMPRCVGRDAQLRELVSAILGSTPDPIPVMGPLGIGKSNLCQRALHENQVIERYAERRYFVRCDGALDASYLAAEVARHLGLPASQHADMAVLRTLEAAPALLVLDNLETPWLRDTLATERFLSMLSGAAGLKLIVTVRGSTRPRGVPWRESVDVKRLNIEDSRTLFLAVAGQKFQADPYLDALINAQDGLPLALELLALRAEGEPGLEALWDTWQTKRSELLRREGVEEDRTSSLGVSFELSFGREHNPAMTEHAQRLACLLGGLPDGIAHEDLDCLLPGAGGGAAATLRKVGLAFTEADRLRMLAPLREYARRQHPPSDVDRESATAHYCGLRPSSACSSEIRSVRRWSWRSRQC